MSPPDPELSVTAPASAPDTPPKRPQTTGLDWPVAILLTVVLSAIASSVTDQGPGNPPVNDGAIRIVAGSAAIAILLFPAALLTSLIPWALGQRAKRIRVTAFAIGAGMVFALILLGHFAGKPRSLHPDRPATTNPSPSRRLRDTP